MRRALCVMVWLLSVTGGGGTAQAATQTPEAARYEVLLIGNSHSAANYLPQMLEAMLKLQHPGVPVKVVRATDYGFLDDHYANPRTRKIFADGRWTHVVLQAQKYSTTGRYRYPTLPAEQWLRKIREHGARGLLFPEWARDGHDEEAARIQALHQKIAAKEPACVVPVGLSWQQLQRQLPELRLHAEDGNHANPAGSLLTAMTLFAVINEGLPELPAFTDLPVSAAHQQAMQAAVRHTLQSHPPGGDCKLVSATTVSAERASAGTAAGAPGAASGRHDGSLRPD